MKKIIPSLVFICYAAAGIAAPYGEPEIISTIGSLKVSDVNERRCVVEQRNPHFFGNTAA